MTLIACLNLIPHKWRDATAHYGPKMVYFVLTKANKGGVVSVRSSETTDGPKTKGPASDNRAPSPSVYPEGVGLSCS
jgi:hypothetical protein